MAGRKNDPNTLMFNIDADSSGLKKELYDLQKNVANAAKIAKKAFVKIGEGTLDEKSYKGINKLFGKSIEQRVSILKNFQKEYQKVLGKVQEAAQKQDFSALKTSQIELKALQEQYESVKKSLNRGMRDEKKTVQAQSDLKAFEESLTPISRQERRLQELNSQLAQARQQYISLKKAGEDTRSAEKAIARTKKQISKLGESTKKTDGFFKTLWGRIKNISIYRAIRTGLKWITQGFEDGINNFVQYDESANSTMSNINASLQQIRNTMGVSLVSILQTLEPIITTITDSFVNLLDSFNLAMAKLAGKDTYNSAKKNIEDYASTVDSAKGSLADFDKIRSLDTQQTDPTEMFSEEKVADNENRASRFFETVLEGVREVWGIISTVWQEFEELGVWDILIDAFTEVLKIIGNVILAIGKMIKWFADIGALEPILYGLVGAWMAYKVAASLAAVSSAAAWLMAHPITGAVAITGAIATLAGVISAINGATKSNISKSDGFSTSMVGLANGGFTTANFIATNENGIKEWVGSNGNSTAVVNDTQMSDIMYGAVKAGCYEGIIDALSDSESYNNASGEVGSSATVEVQGDTLFTIINTEARKRGLKFVRI